MVLGGEVGEIRCSVCSMVSNTDHFDGRRFFNPTGPALQPLTAVPRMLFERRTKWPAPIDGQPTRPPRCDDAAAVVTFIGHATFLIQTAAGSILTDPMYSERAGPWSLVGPRRPAACRLVRRPAAQHRVFARSAWESPYI
jgi:hypothetical protein